MEFPDNLKLSGNNLNRYAKSGGQLSISQAKINSLLIPLPPIEVQKEIVAEIEGYQKIVEKHQEQIESNEQKIKQLIKKIWE